MHWGPFSKCECCFSYLCQALIFVSLSLILLFYLLYENWFSMQNEKKEVWNDCLEHFVMNCIPHNWTLVRCFLILSSTFSPAKHVSSQSFKARHDKASHEISYSPSPTTKTSTTKNSLHVISICSHVYHRSTRIKLYHRCKYNDSWKRKNCEWKVNYDGFWSFLFIFSASRKPLREWGRNEREEKYCDDGRSNIWWLLVIPPSWYKWNHNSRSNIQASSPVSIRNFKRF